MCRAAEDKWTWRLLQMWTLLVFPSFFLSLVEVVGKIWRKKTWQAEMEPGCCNKLLYYTDAVATHRYRHWLARSLSCFLTPMKWMWNHDVRWFYFTTLLISTDLLTWPQHNIRNLDLTISKYCKGFRSLVQDAWSLEWRSSFEGFVAFFESQLLRVQQSGLVACESSVRIKSVFVE